VTRSLATLAHASPYKGLASYAEEDAELFFGRERECEVILSNLKARRLTLLYGESGVGKSSLLRAGVAARLLADAEMDVQDLEAPDFMPVVFSAWRDDPAVGLARAIFATVARFGGPAAPSDGGVRIDEGIVASGALGTQLLVILDQFEEYFLYHPRRDGSDAFAETFPRVLNAVGLHANFLVAIREDALAKLDRFKAAVPRLFDASLRVERLDHAAAREAIVKPLRRYNDARREDEEVTISPELVDMVVDQVTTGHVVLEQAGLGVLPPAANPDKGSERIEAPYLQLVMSRLWETERAQGSRELRMSTLQALGGAAEIVRTHLDAALSDLSSQDRDTAAEVFHHLVTPSGSKIAHAASDLAEYTRHSEAEIVALLETLGRADIRIVRPLPPPPGENRPPRFEIYHDVLALPILDWRVRRSTARRVAEEKRATLRRVRRRVAIGVTLAGLALLALLVLRARHNAARDAAAARQQAAIQREIALFFQSVRTTYNYVIFPRSFIFQRMHTIAPQGSIVTAACVDRDCGHFRATVDSRRGVPITIFQHRRFRPGEHLRLAATHSGVGKQFVFTLTHSGVDTTTQRCRPRGSSIPPSQLPTPCRE
jgi:Novel STAND NTPase 1